MATKRMFNRDFVNDDRFLDLSTEAKLLYFYIGLNADDDGFLANTTAICRLLGTSKDTIHELVKAGYVIDFGTGVYLIVHFKFHNTLKGDRYHETVYIDERSQVEYDDVNKAWELNGTKMEPQYSIDKESKDSVEYREDIEQNRESIVIDKQISSSGTNLEPTRNQDGTNERKRGRPRKKEKIDEIEIQDNRQEPKDDEAIDWPFDLPF